MKLFSLSLKLLFRDIRSGEIKILIAALIIAVAALTSVNIYSYRVSVALDNQATELLGGDLLLSSNSAPLESWVEQAHRLKLQSTEMILFPTIAIAANQLQLVNIKAVSANYPLRGKLRTTLNPARADKSMNNIPSMGSVWVDGRLLSLLNINVGNEIKIGAMNFSVARIITYEPDSESNWFNIAPRIIMNSADVAKTQIVQPGSRVVYRIAFIGTPASLRHFKQWLTPQLKPGQKLLGIKDARPELRNVLQRTNNFLQLAILISIILAGVAIATSAQRYCERHYDTTALLRCFGLKHRQIILLFGFQFVVIGTIASAIGCFFAFIAQIIFADIFSSIVNLTLPQTSFAPIITGFFTGWIILIGFAIPPFWQFKNISPLRVLRRDLMPTPLSILSLYGLPIVVVALILFWQMRDIHLTLLVLYGIALTVFLLYFCARLLIKGSNFFRRYTDVTWRYGLANLSRRAKSSTVQLISFGLVIAVMLLLTLVRNDLFSTWKQQLPVHAPNYFAINIQPNDVKLVQDLLNNFHTDTAGIYPMVRGRLVKLNGIAIKKAVPVDARNHNALNRELNLTWTTKLPADNRIVSGSWWTRQDSNKNLISIEESLAKDLKIRHGDILTFQVGDQTIDAKVANIRYVNWDSFRPNFYIIFPSGVLQNFPTTYITSFYLSQNNKNALLTLVKKFPSVTIIDIDELLRQIRSVMDKMSRAIEYLLMFTLFAGIAALYAAIQASRDERLYESAILRTLGASKKQLQIALAAEFISLGILAGLLGAVSALILSFVLSHYIFNFTYHFNAWVLFAGLLGGGVLVGAIGLFAARKIFKEAPIVILRE